MIFALKLTKFPSFTQNVPEMPKFYTMIARKYFYGIYFLLGGVSRGNPIAPVSYAYGWATGPPPAKSGPDISCQKYDSMAYIFTVCVCVCSLCVRYRGYNQSSMKFELNVFID